MLKPLHTVFSVLAVIGSLTLAQSTATSTCNPLSTPTCSPDPALNTASFSSPWTSSSSLNGWKTTAGSVSFNADGAEFVINKEGDAPTIETDFYIFYGYFEVKMKAAAGTGIVSSVVMLSDVNDEIDWEFTGGNTAQTQTNYFGKGYTGTYNRAVWYPVATPQTTYHTYAVNWTVNSISWIIDGTTVRTLAPADADGGVHFPQTPMRCKLGIWAGGDPTNEQGTIEWAGGETQFSQAPFTMTVQSVRIENYSPGTAYSYSDTSGSSGSIKVQAGSANSNGGVFAPSESSSSSAPPTTSSDPPKSSSAPPKSSADPPKSSSDPPSSTATKAAATTPAATTKPTGSTSSSSITVSSSVESSAAPTGPLQAGATSVSSSTRAGASASSSGGGSGSGSGSGSSSSSSSSSAPSSSATGSGSSLGIHTTGGDNALVALVLFVLAALCAF